MKILFRIEIKIDIFYMYPCRKNIDPFAVCPGREIVRRAIIIFVTFPCIDNPVVFSAGSSGRRMIQSEIFPNQLQNLDIPKTSGPRPGDEITSGTNRSIRIQGEIPSKKYPFISRSSFEKIELFHTDSSAESARSHSEIFVIVIPRDDPVTVLVAIVGIRIGIIVDKLLTVLSVSLFYSNKGYGVSIGIETVNTTGISHRGIGSAYTMVQSVSVIRPGAPASIVSKAGKYAVVTGSGCRSDHSSIPVFFIIDIPPRFYEIDEFFRHTVEFIVEIQLIRYPVSEHPDISHRIECHDDNDGKHGHGNDHLYEGESSHMRPISD